ncbi:MULTISPECIES: hypothetical protein [Bacillus]|uniref:hypothetical protein n=1 Tax=Bacillus TaxID=1386 RepID=UPI000B569BCE|nr:MULTISPECIES: hypothetical protein [Bacillus]ARW41680.1 hypothetical protein S100141_00357 [Bacillus licheniformis]MCA1182443.1 hypothetical protein [Bacillus licheniformis]MEC0474953.1 hypothetical protein [Bacillus licheniformis]
MADEKVCSVCGREVFPDYNFFDRDEVCDRCWKEWEQEKREQEHEYWRSRL